VAFLVNGCAISLSEGYETALGIGEGLGQWWTLKITWVIVGCAVVCTAKEALLDFLIPQPLMYEPHG
jgi:hypothetical protein